MPGVVKKIQCEEGDSVVEGTIIVTLEAMKMQNPLFAPMTGRVSESLAVTQKLAMHTTLEPHCSFGVTPFR